MYRLLRYLMWSKRKYSEIQKKSKGMSIFERIENGLGTKFEWILCE